MASAHSESPIQSMHRSTDQSWSHGYGEAQDAEAQERETPDARASRYAGSPGTFKVSGLPVRVMRRRATLPHPVECSTIAVPGLSFRVRNGTGRLTWAMTAANLLLYSQTPRSAGLVAAREPDRGRDALIRLVFIPCSLPYGMVCRRMMRSPNRSGNECCLSSVSTGRLHPSRGFHVRPIDHVFCMGTTAARGCTEC